jgi:hypothetical protein
VGGTTTAAFIFRKVCIQAGHNLTTVWCALQVTVYSLMHVQPWSSPESHVAGAQGH